MKLGAEGGRIPPTPFDESPQTSAPELPPRLHPHAQDEPIQETATDSRWSWLALRRAEPSERR